MMLDWIVEMFNNSFGWLLNVWEQYGIWIIFGLIALGVYMYMGGGFG